VLVIKKVTLTAKSYPYLCDYARYNTLRYKRDLEVRLNCLLDDLQNRVDASTVHIFKDKVDYALIIVSSIESDL
jgi:hypothetical protein